MARKRTSKGTIRTDVGGGVVQGFVGTESVRIENLNFYGSVPAQPPQEADESGIPPCPYPGLAYFGPQDSARFFGRTTAIARLKAAVTRQALTALVGASGTGKSSVVLAGLAPQLHSHGGWRFTHFRAGANPFLALARAVVPLLGERGATERLEEVQRLASQLESGTVSLSNALGACRASNPGKHILVIADQFEEVFTLVNDEVLRRRFIDSLVASFPDRADGNSPDICLVLTLRGDFLGMALRHRPLSDALQDRMENLGPMTREELREAIVQPAGAVKFENGLVDTLLDDVDSRPGSLPLLQFALREMWGRLDKRRMTRAIYEEIGGVEGALAQRAQVIYDALTKSGEDRHAVMLFRRLFTRLVTLGEGVEDTRRIVGREELGQKSWELAQRLAGEDNRLVVTNAPAPDHETAEVVHEALIRNWPKLIEWVDRDRAFQSWLRQLKLRVDEWRERPEDNGTLLRGGPLTTAKEWLLQRSDELSENERNYIDLSLMHERLVIRRARRVRVLIYALLGGIIVGLVGWINQAYIKEQMNWYMTIRPYRIKNVDPYVLPPEVERALKPMDIFRECAKDCPEMIVIPAGSFMMGSPVHDTNEYPQHQVTIANPFAVSKFVLTFDDWDACAAYGDCDPHVSDDSWGRGQQPLINVTWHGAKRYVAWLSSMTGKPYRLLTEAEYEYAARAGTQTAYPWGDEIGKEKNANCGGCGSQWDGKKPAPVGSFAPNGFGLYDMIGNVWAWVEDCYHPNYERDPNDGRAPTDGSAWISGECDRRVVRGGSYREDPQRLRSAHRFHDQHNAQFLDLGFRVGRTLTP
jgi:formylglycine-generating enzyme required for sulfatase activity